MLSTTIRKVLAAHSTSATAGTAWCPTPWKANERLQSQWGNKRPASLEDVSRESGRQLSGIADRSVTISLSPSRHRLFPLRSRSLSTILQNPTVEGVDPMADTFASSEHQRPGAFQKGKPELSHVRFFLRLRHSYKQRRGPRLSGGSTGRQHYFDLDLSESCALVYSLYESLLWETTSTGKIHFSFTCGYRFASCIQRMRWGTYSRYGPCTSCPCIRGCHKGSHPDKPFTSSFTTKFEEIQSLVSTFQNVMDGCDAMK